MKFAKLLSVFLLAGAMTLTTACSDDDDQPQPGQPDTPGIPGAGVGSDDTDAPEFDSTIYPYQGQTATDAARDVVGTDADIYYEANEFDKTVTVAYNGAEAQVTSTSDDVICHRDGSHVVVDMLTNAVKGVRIVVSGTTPDGSLKIYGEKKFLLSLEGADITSRRGPAINSQCKKRMFVNLKAGTVNSLTDAESYLDDIYYQGGATADSEDRKGCLFGEGSMIFSGTGVLKVAGLKRHGIATDGYFYMRPGVTVAVTEAVKNAIHVKGSSSDGIGVQIEGGLIYANVASDAGKCIKCDLSVGVNGGQLQLNTSGGSVYDEDDNDTSSPSCIKADGDIVITGGEHILKSVGQGGKGISSDSAFEMTGGTVTITTTGTKYYYTNDLTSSPKGVKADGDVRINGGQLNISVSGISDGSEGLESKAHMTISGGDVYVYAYDDAINAGTAFDMSGGRVFAHSVNNDGVDSNGTLTVSGGLIIASGANTPEESFDCDNSSNFTVAGGTLIGIAGGCTTPGSRSSQCSVLCGGLSASKGNNLAVLDADGSLVLAYRLHRSLTGCTLFVSSPKLLQGSTYTLQSGATITDSDGAWLGYYQGGSCSGGAEAATITLTSLVTTVGSTGGGGGMGPGMGNPGGFPR